jgi:hypothetical protein
MIELYTAETPNGSKISIAFKELALPYRVRPIRAPKDAPRRKCQSHEPKASTTHHIGWLLIFVGPTRCCALRSACLRRPRADVPGAWARLTVAECNNEISEIWRRVNPHLAQHRRARQFFSVEQTKQANARQKQLLMFDWVENSADVARQFNYQGNKNRGAHGHP